MFLKGFVIVLALFVQGHEAKLPADIEACKAGDKECFLSTINKVIETKFKGDPDLNIQSFDPISIPEISFKQSKKTPISVDLTFNNIKIYGLKNFKAVDVSGFGANPEGKHEIQLKGPTSSLIGDFVIDGKILILPVKGSGHSNITLDDIIFKIIIDAGSKTKDGKVYLEVKDVEIKLEKKTVHFEFTNVKSQEKLLEDINKFINENADEVYDGLVEPMLKGLAESYKKFVGKMFETHPYNELVK